MLSSAQLSELIYRHDIRKLRTVVGNYLVGKDMVLILIDNIDKGWDAGGVTSDDLMVIRTLIEAMRKLERSLGKGGVEFHSLVFLRNDVFELLVDETPDRGKEGKVVIDWGNREVLKQLIGARIKDSTKSASNRAGLNWNDICVPWIDEIDSLDWLLDRCMMRPRYLIDLADRCLGYAVTLQRETIDSDALKEGWRTFSLDVVANTNFELRDIDPVSVQCDLLPPKL